MVVRNLLNEGTGQDVLVENRPPGNRGQEVGELALARTGVATDQRKGERVASVALPVERRQRALFQRRDVVLPGPATSSPVLASGSKAWWIM